MKNIIRQLIQLYYRAFPLKSVKYYHKKDTERAFVTQQKGYFEMVIDGEDYPYPGFPRGYLLSTALFRIKHAAKNKVFNDTWKELDEGKPRDEILTRIVGEVKELGGIIKEYKHFQLPQNKMCPTAREIYRASTVIEKKLPKKQREVLQGLRDCLTFIFQEDDGYRFRLQWVVSFFNPRVWWYRILRRDPVKDFISALGLIEHAETLDDMKGRMRLLKRVSVFLLEDPWIKWLFNEFCNEINWNKLKLSEADKYYFRAKYFKTDYQNPNSFLGRLVNEVLY